MTARHEADDTAAKLTAASADLEYRAVARRDTSGPGFVLEVRTKGEGRWGYVGWSEDVIEKRGVFSIFERILP